MGDEVVVEVARIIRDLVSRPRRQRDPLRRACHLDLGKHQTLIIAVEDVDLPGLPGEALAMPGLLDQRPLAQLIEKNRRVVTRDPRTRAG
jgi:hypothetical protein